jgi:hypothetical protein
MNSREGLEHSQIKWYLKPIAVIAAIFCLGALALPLVWLSPAFKRSHKIAITAALILLTAWLTVSSVKIYHMLLQKMIELQELMR